MDGSLTIPMNRHSLPAAGLGLFVVCVVASCRPTTRTVQPDYDSDGDGIVDYVDVCPFGPGLAPDGCPTPDSDDDGFLDDVDVCSDFPGGAPYGCPIPDTDEDGFLDNEDKCPYDQGIEPDGCPIPDTDGDIILDPDDKCPTVPENKNGYQDEDGCPDEIPTQLARYKRTFRGINFENNGFKLTKRAKKILQRMISVLSEFSTIRIKMRCHSDSVGWSVGAYKAAMAKRAKQVKDFLVAGGISAKRLEIRGATMNEPVTAVNTQAGRAEHTRCDMEIWVE